MTGRTLRKRVFLRPPINKGAMPGRVEVCATSLRIISRPQANSTVCRRLRSSQILLFFAAIWSKTRWMRETAVSVVQEAVRPGRAEQGYDERVKIRGGIAQAGRHGGGLRPVLGYRFPPHFLCASRCSGICFLAARTPLEFQPKPPLMVASYRLSARAGHPLSHENSDESEDGPRGDLDNDNREGDLPSS